MVMAIACSLLLPQANINSGQIEAKAALARLGVEEKDFTDPVAVARALRSTVVDEWLGENQDNYQGFSTVDNLLQYRIQALW